MLICESRLSLDLVSCFLFLMKGKQQNYSVGGWRNEETREGEGRQEGQGEEEWMARD